jgi:hypothetical protein
MMSSIQPLEVGTLTTISPGESQFLGSSSGVFFVNTVHRAFAISKNGLRSARDNEAEIQGHTSIDDCIVGSETPREQGDDFGSAPLYGHGQTTNLRSYGIFQDGLGLPPSISSAKELLTVYFRVWHPLFPFLHGPTFLHEIETFYGNDFIINVQGFSQNRRNTCRAVVLQCVFNIAAMDRPDLELPKECRIELTASLLSSLGTLLYKHDLPSLQALLAAQIYLVVTMSLHAASTVGGILLRAMFHSGFHRCPFRYPQLTEHDREIRKRIFWTAYAIDRYLSQALGYHLGIQDSDIDVCFPGTEELHSPMSKPAQNSEDVALHSPKGQGQVTWSPTENVRQTVDAGMASPDEASDREANNNQPPRSTLGEDIFASYVIYSRLTGRSLELFHKSIHIRSLEQDDILMLASEVHSWWNSLPQQVQDLHVLSTSDGDCGSDSQLVSFFTVIYQQLILLINRPFLSHD